MVEATRLPSSISSKKEFYDLICAQLEALLEGERNWITNLSNASALLFWAFRDSQFWGNGESAVNWCGFYLDSRLFRPSSSTSPTPAAGLGKATLQLGPFQGRPACLSIVAQPGGGVCADAYVHARPVVVRDVHDYPGHIACDGETNSEVVVPLVLGGRKLGVLDLDCLSIGGFGAEDVEGLEKVVRIVLGGCYWPHAGEK